MVTTILKSAIHMHEAIRMQPLIEIQGQLDSPPVFKLVPCCQVPVTHLPTLVPVLDMPFCVLHDSNPISSFALTNDLHSQESPHSTATHVSIRFFRAISHAQVDIISTTAGGRDLHTYPPAPVGAPPAAA